MAALHERTEGWAGGLRLAARDGGSQLRVVTAPSLIHPGDLAELMTGAHKSAG